MQQRGAGPCVLATGARQTQTSIGQEIPIRFSAGGSAIPIAGGVEVGVVSLATVAELPAALATSTPCRPLSTFCQNSPTPSTRNALHAARSLLCPALTLPLWLGRHLQKAVLSGRRGSLFTHISLSVLVTQTVLMFHAKNQVRLCF